MKRPRRILTAVDLSEGSDRVLMAASTMAQAFDASLHVLHVREPFATPTTSGAVPIPGRGEVATDFIDAALSRIAERLTAAAVPSVTTSAAGPAATTIMEQADQIAADLIVIGTHGRGGAAHALLGSVAERVVQKAHRPVLVVPTR
jgi:nucleotide-binding universal stress UspA family protein